MWSTRPFPKIESHVCIRVLNGGSYHIFSSKLLNSGFSSWCKLMRNALSQEREQTIEKEYTVGQQKLALQITVLQTEERTADQFIKNSVPCFQGWVCLQHALFTLSWLLFPSSSLILKNYFNLCSWKIFRGVPKQCDVVGKGRIKSSVKVQYRVSKNLGRTRVHRHGMGTWVLALIE